MAKPIPTVRSLARELGLSPTTVSEALRDVSRVKPETARRVKRAAKAAGYRVNPLASAVMSEIRRSGSEVFRGMLAAATMDEAQRPAYALKFFKALIRGATERAQALGFGMETFLVGRRGVPLHRLDTILQARGIRALILLPAWDSPDFTKLDWRRYAGVYTDYIIERPALHAVCSDHYRSMTAALHRLHLLGYRRPGLFLNKHQDERLQNRWAGAFLAFQSSGRDLAMIPPLVQDEIARKPFVEWFRKYQPDVVLSHHSEAMDWMESCGARIARTHGFFCLNTLMQDRPCAGLDLQPQLLGARAAQLVIDELHRNELGIPKHPSLVTMPAKWVDGPTLRSGRGMARSSSDRAV